jgi:1-acyl-sn-glycerol-3-phosphate acyltransferase
MTRTGLGGEGEGVPLRSAVNPERERFYPLTVARYAIGYATYSLSKAVFVLLALPLLLVLWPFPRAKHRVLARITQRFLAFLSRVWLPALGLYRIVEISGRDQALAARPAVFVANHRGRLDGPMLLGLLPDTGIIIKAKEGRQAAFALLMRHFDFIGVEANRLSSAATALARAQQVLAAGRSLLVFPEGTRAGGGRLQPFKDLAFQLARETGVPVVPVVVHSTVPFMAKRSGSWFPRGRNQYRVRFLDPEPARPEDRAADLSDRVRRRLAHALKSLDVGTVWETAPRSNHE